MIRTILSVAILTSFIGLTALKADPSPNSTSSPSKKKETPPAPTAKTNSSKTPTVTPAQPLPEGWSLVNGTWMHSDGYKLVNGQVMRIGNQTHKRPPKPPTQAELNAAKTKTTPNAAATKATERERNSRVIPASQTGTHL
jgi:hypothetical protein